MRLLTPSGYQNIEDLGVGDDVSAFDIETGDPIINHIEKIEPVSKEDWDRWHQTADAVPPFVSYKINGQFVVFCEESIWTSPTTVKHGKHLVVGDTIYDDGNADQIITSIEEVVHDDNYIWYRLEISGDHSFIADGATYHNASRFWVLGTGTWDNSATTNWSATTGGAGGSSAPGSADTVTLDGSSGGGVVTPNATLTVQSITCGAFTGTLAFNTNNNNVTLSAATTALSITGSATRTINLGSGTFTFTNSGATLITASTTTGLTLTAINATFTFTNTGTISITLGASTSWGTFNVNMDHGTGSNSFTFGNGSSATIKNITTVAGNQPNIIFSTLSATITTLNLQAGATFQPAANVTVTNAFTLTGTSTKPIFMQAQTLAGQITISVSTGTCLMERCIFKNVGGTGGATFTARNSIALNGVTGITVTPPISSPPTYALGI